MAVIETWYNQDLQNPVKVHYLNGNLFSHNGNGNRIGVHVFDNGEPVTLAGTVSGYVVTSDGSTVPCTGSRSGNNASILVPPAAYQPGAVFITVFLTDGNTVTTLASVSTSVLVARTGNQVSPGSVVTDWTQTINAAMQDVETAAENLGHIVATPYASLTFPVPLGKYTYYNNNLYRCISPIASSESFTPAHWSSAINMGDEVSSLKSALEQSNTEIDTIENELYVFVDITSTEVKSKATGAIETNTIGETIVFGTQTNILHYYLDVAPGEIFKIQIRKAANTLYNIVFTDSNGVVKKLYGQGNGTMHVDVETIAVPENATRLYISAQESSGPADWNVNDRVQRAIWNNKLIANCLEQEIDAKNITFGRVNFNNGTIGVDGAYCYTPIFIPVNTGDALYRKYSDVGFGVAYYDKNYAFVGSTGNAYQYITNPIYIPYGVAFIRVGFQLANSTSPAISDFDGIITIIRFENRNEKLTLGILNRVEHSKYNDCIHGYINSNNGAINNHNYYMATVKYFRVKPGDIVRCANEDLNIWVMEYDINLSPVRHSDGYVRSLSRNPYPAGEWHVKTDGYIRAYFTNFQAQTEVDISTYYNSLEIVHSLSALNEYDAYVQKTVAPTNWVKARKIREGSDLYTQSCAIIKGYLYCTIDDYQGYTVIQKVDIETGEVVKTYTQDFGHATIDYCEETDTLLLKYGATTLALYPNFSEALEGNSLTIDDCIQIDCGDVLSDASICFGEDEYTVYAFVGHDTSAVRHDKCYKIQLGFGETDLSEDGYGTYTESNSYNGTAKLLKTFNGIIREFHDGQYGGRSLSYAQDMKYDGYLYLCFGTYGYNCYVIDLDELSETYKIVGNYKIKYRSSDYSDLYGEAEGLAINGSKIVTTLRDTVGGFSCMFEFNRN